MSDVEPIGRWRPLPGVVFRRVDDEAVLLDTRSGVYFGLNPTGAVLWQALDAEPASLAELEEILRRAFAADERTLRSDVRDWLVELRNHGLLEWIE